MVSHLKYKTHICEKRESENMQKRRQESFTETVYLKRVEKNELAWRS